MSRRLLKEYEEVLEGYVPVLMSMARIYWDRCCTHSPLLSVLLAA